MKDPKPVCRYHQKTLRNAVMSTGRKYLRCPTKGCPVVAAIPGPVEVQSHNFKESCGKWLETGA